MGWELRGQLGGSSSTPGYQRPPDWLDLPAVNTGDHKFVGLHAVFNHTANFVAFTFAGAYTVDWGDGSAPENVAADTQANHNYVWSDLSSDTLTSLGYRQAIVTVTMQSGQTFTKVDLFLKHSQANLPPAVGTGWLDIKMAGASVSNFQVSSTSTTVVRHRLLEQFEYVGPCADLNLSNVFYACSALESIIGTQWTAVSVNCTGLFQECYSLQTIPLLDTHLCTNFGGMFRDCFSLRTIPLIDTHLGTSFASMFNGCSNLQSIPLLVTSAGTTFASMFSTCFALQSVPLLNTAAGTTFTSMFLSCPSLAVGALSGTTRAITYASKLSSAAIDAIYTALGTASGAQTITTSGNYGYAGSTPSIATAKGWTVA